MRDKVIVVGKTFEDLAEQIRNFKEESWERVTKINLSTGEGGEFICIIGLGNVDRSVIEVKPITEVIGEVDIEGNISTGPDNPDVYEIKTIPQVAPGTALHLSRHKEGMSSVTNAPSEMPWDGDEHIPSEEIE